LKSKRWTEREREKQMDEYFSLSLSFGEELLRSSSSLKLLFAGVDDIATGDEMSSLLFILTDFVDGDCTISAKRLFSEGEEEGVSNT
jgi:hypothetical protein